MNMRKGERLKGILAKPAIFILTAALLLQGPGVAFAEDTKSGTEFLAETTAGTPYAADGSYDVETPHVIVNQIYGGSDDGAASHSFIELYNQTEESVDLSGWHVAYRSSQDGDHSGQWQYLELSGTIEGKGYFLIRCGEAGGEYQVPEGNMQWDVQLHNKGISVVLLSSYTELTEDFSGAVSDGNRPEGYVDLLAVQGNDEDEDQLPPVFEGSVGADQSKKKAVRRDNFTDTDDNAADTVVIDYSDPVEEENGPHGPAGSGDVPDDGKEPETPVSPVYTQTGFDADAKVQLKLTGRVTVGTANADGGVAEIVAYNADNGKAYVVNGQEGHLDVIDVRKDGSLETESTIQVKDLISGFEYGDMTSVAVDTANDHIVIALQASDYSAAGRIAVLDYDGQLIESFVTGVQPDMITVSKDGKWILTADEGEPRNGYKDGAVDPAGSVTIVNTATKETRTVGFEDFDSEQLAGQGVLFNKIDGQILSAENDLEPEYIALDADGTTAYVSLQEANAIATLDIESGQFTSIKSIGFQDLSLEPNMIDLVEDGKYEGALYEDTYGVRMPDGISVFEIGGKTYIATANEGDAREWGDFTNETKTDIQDTNGNTAEDVRTLDHDVTAGLEDGKNYLYGSRSFTIFDADTMEVVYDSANEFESRTASYLAAWFNCSNDDIDMDSRSAKKGVEPEAITIEEVDGRYYAFIALERIGGIMVYDVTDPAGAEYVNYINTRDFSQEIAGDVAPEGLAFISTGESESGSPVLLAACEVSGTVAAYTLSGSAVTPGEPVVPGEPTVPGDDDVTDDSGDDGIGDETTGNDEKTQVSDAVKTGDTALIYLFAALMLAAMAIALISAYRYRSEKNR